MQNIDVWMFKVRSSNSGEKKKKKVPWNVPYLFC